MLKPLKYMDWVLFASLLVLAVIGAFFIYSASYQISRSSGINFTERQIIWLILGMVLYFLLAVVDYRRIVSFAYPLFGATVILLLFISVFGEVRFGARRWLNLGAFTIQPSEFAKVTLVLILARHFSERFSRRWSWSYLLVPCSLAAVPAALILKQPDLGTALVFVPVVIGMAFVARARTKHLLTIILILIFLAPVFWFLLKDYQRARILVFINPGLDPLGSGYTAIQSKIAIGSGHILGKGWLSGTQNMLNFLPERQTDFVFSVVAEEWGFVGSLFLLGLYSLVIYRLFMIAQMSRDLTGLLLGAGGLIVFSTHVVVNIGMALGLLPATGLPLPLLSYGGSVTTAILAVLGICQSVYVHRYWY